MARLMISEYHAAAIRVTERGTAARKGVWAGIRAALSIPDDVKFGVEVNPQAPHYREVYLKGSEPRRYLSATSGGFYFGVEAASQAAAQQVGQPSQAPVGRRFTPIAPADNALGALCRVRRSDLLALLRRALEDSDLDCDCEGNVDEPVGFPTLPQDGLVLDNATGDLYFRADPAW